MVFVSRAEEGWGTRGFGEEAWGDLVVTGVDPEGFQVPGEHFRAPTLRQVPSAGCPQRLVSAAVCSLFHTLGQGPWMSASASANGSTRRA